MTTFMALLQRDFLVGFRRAGPMLFADLSQPILIAVVFAVVFPKLNMVTHGFDTLVLPGLVAVTILMNGVHSVLYPLSEDLAGNREVNERLLAPITVSGVALQKILVGTLTASFSGLVTLPMMMLLMRGASVHVAWPVFLPVILAASLVSATFGMTLGSLVGGAYSSYIFDIIVGPMLLFGCAYFPWQPLYVIGPLRYVLLVNPLVFMSEALRMALTPQVAHMPVPLLAPGLLAIAVVLTFAALWAFRRRAIL